MREETIYYLLHNDHETVAALFEQRTATESAGQRERLLAQLKLELMAHSEAEDIVFYQPLKEVDDARGSVLEAAEEHRVVARLLGELERLSAENEHLLSMLAAKGIGGAALDSVAVLPVAVSLDAVERIKRDSSLFRSASLPSFIEPQEVQPEKQPLYDRLLGKFTR